MAEKTYDIDELKNTVRDGLEQARYQMLLNSPFIGTVASKFEIVPTYETAIRTACTNGQKIFFDIEFYSELTKEERMFVLAHEVWHNLFMHFTRMHGRIPSVWNQATDMEINYELTNDVSAGLKMPKDGLLPSPQLAGQNAETIYDALLKEMQKQQQKQNQKGNQQGGGGSGSGGSGSDDSQGDADGDQDGENLPDELKKAMEKLSNGGKQLDKHINPSQKGNGNEGEDEDDNEGRLAEARKGKFGPREISTGMTTATTADIGEIENNIKDIMSEAVQSVERQQGNVPGRIKEMVTKLLKPEVNWKAVLSQFVTKCIGGDRSWSRCSRHGLTRDMYLPGRSDESLKLLLAIDTSGSTSSDLPKFLGELKALVESFGQYDMTMLQCDTEIQDEQHYTANEPMDVTKFEMKGFGGTSFRPIFEWYNKNGGSEDFSCIIVFTDGYGDAPKYPPDVPVLWVITKDGTEDFCNWGEKLRFKCQVGDKF